MDAFRKQLDALMGANRNGDVEEIMRNYWDRDICRHHLCGLCPHELFQLTKMDLGVCAKLHSLQLRKEYEEAFAKGTDTYERELEECLDKHILECDRKIQRALKRLEDDNAEGAIAIAVSSVTKSAESDELSAQIAEKLKEAEELEMAGNTDDKIRIMDVVEELRQKRADVQAQSLLEAFNKDRLLPPSAALPPPPGPPLNPPDARTQEMIKEKLKRAEELGEEGLVDEAQKAMEEAEALKKLGSRPDINPLPPPPGGTMQVLTAQADQKLRVCDICGAFLSIYDSDRRLADHFGGKLHLGYMAIRQKQAELKERKSAAYRKVGGGDVRAPDEVREKSRDTERRVERERSKERDRDRGHKDRDRERDRDRDRERERDMERDGGRHREREPERRRERDGGRDRDRDRESRRDRDDRGRRDRY